MEHGSADSQVHDGSSSYVVSLLEDGASLWPAARAAAASTRASNTNSHDGRERDGSDGRARSACSAG
jgi:hypothetical protein